jgi:diacylglycerol O-acyltransferase
VLTAVSTGLHDLLVARGEAAPEAGLRAMVPVNVRPGGDGSLGNRISSRFVALPVAEPELERRHQLVMAAAGSAKHGHQPTGAATMLALAEHLPPVLHTTFARSLFGTRLFNVTVTNVPGPAHVSRTFRSRLTDIVPIVPLAAEHAVGVAVISHAGALTFCVNADRDSVPDAQLVADGITRALCELRVTAEEEVPA